MALGLVFATRILPVLLVLTTTVIVPWCQRTFLISGLSGKNFAQTNVEGCEIVYPGELVGCEDLHVYEGGEGPLIFTGCVETLRDRLVCRRGGEGGDCRLGFLQLRQGISRKRGSMLDRFMFMIRRRRYSLN
jgi:hypothetical protein